MKKIEMSDVRKSLVTALATSGLLSRRRCLVVEPLSPDNPVARSL